VPQDSLWNRYIVLREELRMDAEKYVRDGAYRGTPKTPPTPTLEDKRRLRDKLKEAAAAFEAWLDS
jgi:hypothetical protein